MVKIDGKYELVENQNFLEFLQKSGISDDLAQKMNQTKPIITAKLVGDNLSVEVENSLQGSQKVEYILNKEVDEVLNKVPLKSIAKLDGDVLTISSKGQNGKSGQRIYKFTETGTEVTLISDDGKAKRIYKRI